jgi:EAL and modified HD-GYP domain-containing signal transduction protein
MGDVHVGRQPIFRPDRSVHGYELLFRAAPDSTSAAMRADAATSAVIRASVLEFGLERLTAPHLAFLNITRSFAVGDLPLPFSSSGVVLELLEDVPIDAEVERGVRVLADQGFPIALDDFEWDQRRECVLPVADYVKIDIFGKSGDELRASIDRLRDHEVRTVAERVETAEDFRMCHDAGFDFLQGYYLLRPAVLSIRTMAPAQLNRLQLLEMLCRPDVSIQQVEDVIASDAGLSYRLLQAVRAAATGVSRPVDSLRTALMLLGMERIRAWVTVLTLAPSGVDEEQAAAAAVTRARFCQVLAAHSAEVNPGAAFLAGVLSGIQATLPTPDVIDRLPLTAALKAAVTERAGSLGQILTVVDAYEQGRVSHRHPLRPDNLPQSYLAALSWSHTLLSRAGVA